MKSRLQWARRMIAGALALGTVAVALPGSATVFDVNQHYSGCITTMGGADSFLTGGNNLTANTLVLECALQDTTSLAHKDVTALLVYYSDQTTTGAVMASRCVTYSNATGGNCGDSVNSGNGTTGIGSLTLPNTPASFASDWNSVAHFAYASVFLPPKTGAGAMSYLKGLYYKK
jgi:hypothetical protein